LAANRRALFFFCPNLYTSTDGLGGVGDRRLASFRHGEFFGIGVFLMNKFGEYWFPAAVAVALIVVGSIPYCYGYLNACPDMKFVGLVGRDVPGGNMYLAWQRQAATGHLLLSNHYTPEHSPAALVLPEWWLMGNAARWTGMSPIAVFHVGRVLSVLFFLFSAYFMVSLCLDTLFQRRFAVLLLVFGSGFGWIPWLVAQVSPFEYPLSYDVDGINVFGMLIGKPHFIRAFALVLLTYALVLEGERTGRRRWFVLSGLCALVHINMRPYIVPETYLLYTLFPILISIKEQKISFTRFANYAIAALIPLPMVLYYVYLMYFGPLGPTWSHLDLAPPHFATYVLWYGMPFLLLFVCFEGFGRVRHMRPTTILLVLWIMLSFGLAQSYPYLKGAYEAAYGMHLVPPILVTVGPLRTIFGWLKRTRVYGSLFGKNMSPETRKHIVAGVFILLCSLSNVVVLGTMFTRMSNCNHPFYISNDFYESMRWLDENSRYGDTVMATTRSGMYIPRFSGNRVFTGHFNLTVKFAEKNELAERFFGKRGDDQFKRRVVTEYNIRYVLVGPYEMRPDGMRPADHPWLDRVFSQGEVSIYEVTT